MIYNTKEEFLIFSANGRLISLDIGKKRIGIAISDENRKIAMPSDTILFTNLKNTMNNIVKIAQIKKITGIIVGLPISFDEKDTIISQFVRNFTKNLSTSLPNVPIIFQDERLSSFMAESFNISLIGVKKTKNIVDKVSASYILEDFLNNDCC